MINNQIPKINQGIPNFFPNPYIMNDNVQMNPNLSQFSLPISMNQSFSPLMNSQYPLLNLLFSDQFLYPNQPLFLPQFFAPQQPQIQLSALNQLINIQKLLNENKIANNSNELNGQINNKKNSLENNYINNNDINIDKEKKEYFYNNLNQTKKFVITHEKSDTEKKANILDILDDKNKLLEKNNINFTLSTDKLGIDKNFSNIINKGAEQNILKINEKNNEIKDNKGKLSLFTISNIKMNINNGINNNNLVQNGNPNDVKSELLLMNNINKKSTQQNSNSSINYEINEKDILNLQNDAKNEKAKYYRCSFKDCNKVFVKQSNLKDHIRTHTGEKPYVCSHPGCGKTFSQHGNLKKHEKIHLGNKKYYCSYPNCGKKFSASYNLKIHYRCHTGERPYKCNFPNCGRSFYDKGNLKYHEKNMHALENMEYPYSCEHMGCNAKFKTKLEKLKHHCEMEIECFIERKELIKLIQRYKIFFRKIVKKKNINEKENEIVQNLKKNYQEIQNKLIDQELFNHYLGEEFDNDCCNIENIEEQNAQINNNESEINSNEIENENENENGNESEK